MPIRAGPVKELVEYVHSEVTVPSLKERGVCMRAWKGPLPYQLHVVENFVHFHHLLSTSWNSACYLMAASQITE